MSLLPYTNDKELDEEHNRLFQLKHPKMLDTNILLSDIIKLKDDLIEIFLKKQDSDSTFG
jgi:hypothetical protein